MECSGWEEQGADPSGGEAALRMTRAEARGRFFVASILRMTKILSASLLR